MKQSKKQRKKQAARKLNLKKRLGTRVKPISDSLLDVMEDGIEFESLCKYDYQNLDLGSELRRSIAEIEAARNKTAICYFSNLFAINNSIDGTDDLPFTEMVNSVPAGIDEVDVILVTPGGNGSQVANFVQTLRGKFATVNFIIIDKAMSAGTIFIMSGDEIVMSKESKFGPIDPQIPSQGRYVPAQSILLTLESIKKRGEDKIKNGGQPDWTDIQLLRQMNPYEIGSAIGSSNFSIELVKRYLRDYKFRNWITHQGSGNPVTPQERESRATTIANNLCNHALWKSHSYAISRDEAWNVCQLLITHAETIPGLERAMRRLRALLFWMGDHLSYSKAFVSQNYCIIKGRG